ncbi:hypothetical protein [Methanogenium organophilum]|uniref:Uncharacterized protein n=1 Tax=Methanogenium organophilum TaxID=2199 RepID=A0A9X9T9K9_METOG|nr:hypothetical protein [Methanogenium organophilum]WAI02202.1 hypothetical protein OU421_04835 [Methanogenium organophilum]
MIFVPKIQQAGARRMVMVSYRTGLNKPIFSGMGSGCAAVNRGRSA